MNSKNIALSTAVVGCIMNASTAFALDIYHDDQEFLSTARIASFENFDEYTRPKTWDSREIVIDGVVYTTSYNRDEYSDSFWALDHEYHAYSDPNGLISNSNIGVDTLSFGENNFVTDFGLWIGPNGHNSFDKILITEIDGYINILDFTPEGINGQDHHFFGFISDIGIESIIFIAPGASRHNWTYDDVYRGEIFTSEPPVTEPPANDIDLALLQSGPSKVKIGKPYTFTVTVENIDPEATATNVKLVTQFSHKFRIDSIVPTQGECSGNSAQHCDLGDIPAWDSVTVDVTVTPLERGKVSTLSTVFADGTDPDTANNVSETETKIRRGGR